MKTNTISTIPKLRSENCTETHAIYRCRNPNVKHVMETIEISTIPKLVLKQLNEKQITMFESTFKNIMKTNAISTIPKIMIKHIMGTHYIFNKSTNEIKTT